MHHSVVKMDLKLVPQIFRFSAKVQQSLKQIRRKVLYLGCGKQCLIHKFNFRSNKRKVKQYLRNLQCRISKKNLRSKVLFNNCKFNQVRINFKKVRRLFKIKMIQITFTSCQVKNRHSKKKLKTLNSKREKR